jgi:chromosomal replication initiation ATPase DnaA
MSKTIPKASYDVIYDFLALCGDKDPTPDQVENIFRNKELMVLLSNCTNNDAYNVVERALYPAEPPSFKDVAQATALAFGVQVEDVLGKGQERWVASARHMLVYILRDCLGASYVEIGKYIGRDHSTAMASCKKVVEEMDPSDSDNYFTKRYFQIISEVLPSRGLII